MSHQHLHDDALSAHLDDPGDAELGGCDTCQARLEALRTARDALAASGPGIGADTARREAAVAAAMAEAHQIGLIGESQVTDLAAVRARRLAGPALGWLAAAAAVVALFGVVGALQDDDSADPGEVAGRAEEPDAAALESLSPEAGDAVPYGGAPGPADLGHLGEFSDEAAFIESLGPFLPQSSDMSASASGGGGDSAGSSGPDDGDAAGGGEATRSADAAVARCQDRQAEEAPETGRALFVARATYQGRPVVVLLHPLGEPESEGSGVGVWVRAADTCDQVLFRAL